MKCYNTKCKDHGTVSNACYNQEAQRWNNCTGRIKKYKVLSLKEQIENARTELFESQKKLRALLAKCTHVYVKQRSSAVCEICKDNGGWWCPDSPNHKCDYEHYDEEMGGSYMDFDQCVHCRLPEERR